MEDRIMNYIEMLNKEIKELAKDNKIADARSLLDLIKFIKDYVIVLTYEEIFNYNKSILNDAKNKYIRTLQSDIDKLEEKIDNLINLGDSNKLFEICNIQDEIKKLREEIDKAKQDVDSSSLLNCNSKETILCNFIKVYHLDSILNPNIILKDNMINIEGIKVAQKFQKGDRRQYEIASKIRANLSKIGEKEYLLTKLSNYMLCLERAIDKYNNIIRKYTKISEEYVKINKQLFKSKNDVAQSNRFMLMMFDCLKTIENIEVIPGLQKLIDCPFFDICHITVNMSGVDFNVFYAGPKPVVKAVKDKTGMQNDILEFCDTNILNITLANINNDTLVEDERKALEEKKNETENLKKELITNNIDDIFNFEQILNNNPKLLKYFLEALELLSMLENHLLANKLISDEERRKIEEYVNGHIKTLVNKYKAE